METISRALLTYGVNALWQLPLVAAAAFVAARFLRQAPARYVHAIWCAALITAVVVPAASIGKLATTPGPPDLLTPFPTFSDAPSALPHRAPAPQMHGTHKPSPWTVPASYAAILTDAFLLWIAFALLRLGLAAWKTIRIRRQSTVAPSSPRFSAAWNLAAEAFRVGKAQPLVSSSISGPVTIGGLSSAIILPESMLENASEDALAAALGHEMAHIERRDFLANLLLELVAIPISFHPAALLIRRRIRQTREMACDELVAARMMDSRVYANLLVRIAASLAGLSHPRLALGIFDGDMLQERVRRLTSGVRAGVARARIAVGAAFATFIAIAIAASGVALPVLAQSAAAPEIRAGVLALNGKDYGAALQHLQSAVAADPSNVNARLYLATACVREFGARPGAERMKTKPTESPLFTCALPQYKEVLALDPNNVNAMFGVALATPDDSQEAHDMMLKVIAADPQNKNAYYVAGAIDWRMAFSAIRKAEKQAGIPPEATQIPDAALRRSLRAALEAQLQEGATMLRTALQLDPKSPNPYAYLNLVYRCEALILDSPLDSANLRKEADSLIPKAISVAKAAQNEPKAPPSALDPDGPPPMPSILPAPPPPPPPPGGSK
jgi:beta-lactamase regulating signal transducer with metallopeptidase domain